MKGSVQSTASPQFGLTARRNLAAPFLFYNSLLALLISLTSLSSLQHCMGPLSTAAGFSCRPWDDFKVSQLLSCYPRQDAGEQLTWDPEDVGTNLICTHTTSGVSLHCSLLLFLLHSLFLLQILQDRGCSPPHHCDLFFFLVGKIWFFCMFLQFRAVCQCQLCQACWVLFIAVLGKGLCGVLQPFPLKKPL